MTRKQLIIFGVIVGVVAVVVIVILLMNNRETSSKVVFQNVQFPNILGQNTLFYYNSGQFYSRDLNTNQVTKLNKDVNTQPEAKGVLWSKNGALFQTIGYDPFGTPSATMSSLNFKQSQSYWWFLNFKTGGISLLGSGQKNHQYSNVLWENNANSIFVTSFVAGDPNNGSTVSFHKINLDNQDSELNGSIAQNYNTIWYGNNSILASYAERLVRVGLSNFEETPILTNVNASRYTASESGQQITYILANDNPNQQTAVEAGNLVGELHLLNLDNDENKVLKRDYLGNVNYSSLNNYFFTYKTNNDGGTYKTDFSYYTTKNVSDTNFNTKQSLNSTVLRSTQPLSLFITDSQNNLRTIGQELPKNLATNGSVNPGQVKLVSEPRVTVLYLADKNKLSVIGKDQDALNTAYNQLKQKLMEQGVDLASMATIWTIIPY